VCEEIRTSMLGETNDSSSSALTDVLMIPLEIAASNRRITVFAGVG
jgi:hypothetical protein